MSRSADEIRDAFLTNLQTEFTALGQRVVTAPKTPFYALGSALALEIEGAEAEASAARLEVFVASASEDGVLNHGEFGGLPRTPASHAKIRVRGTGTPSTTVPIASGKQLTDPQGQVFNADATSISFDGVGTGYTTVTARDTGAESNVALGTALTWQNGAPAGVSATMTAALATGDTTHLLIVGAALESIEDYRARIKLWQKERKQGGNRGDFAGWAEEVEGVGLACVYPRAWYYGGVWRYGTPGTLTLVVLASAPPADSYVQNSDGTLGLGLQPTYTRVPTTTLRTRVKDYIEGRVDAAGRAVPPALQVQKRPVGLAEANWASLFFDATATIVVVSVEVDPGVAPWPWSTTRTVSAATTTTLTLTSTAGIPAGARLAVYLGTSVIRGGWWLATVQSVAGSVLTLSAAMPATPANGAEVRPDPGCWGDVRRIVLGQFDRLGTGDTPSNSPAFDSARYPRPNDRGPDRLTAASLIAELEGLTGLVNVTVILPGGISYVAPNPGDLLTPAEIRLQPL